MSALNSSLLLKSLLLLCWLAIPLSSAAQEATQNPTTAAAQNATEETKQRTPRERTPKERLTGEQRVAKGRVGVIEGVVINFKSGEPIAGAIVQVLNDTLQGVSDSEGRYRIERVRMGYNTLYGEGEGFRGMVAPSVMVTRSEVAEVNFELDPFENQELEEIVVTASPLVATVESPLSLRRFGTEEIDLTPGANRDISRVVQSAPGVVSIKSNNRNDLLVRGGGANENKYFLDGIEIPILNHFSVQGGSGGYASLVNTYLLSSTNFYTGAFPTNYGNALSSVLDMQLRTGNSESFDGRFSIGATDAEISLDTPLSKDGRTTLLASFRQSYLQFLFSALNLPFLPTFNDYQFKLNHQISERESIYLIGLGSFDKNRVNRDIENPTESDLDLQRRILDNDQNSQVIGAGYRKRWSGRSLRTVLSFDRFANDYYRDITLSDEPVYKGEEGNVRFRSEMEWWDLGAYRVNAGIGGGYGFNHQMSLWRYSIFGNVSRYLFEDRLSLMLGLRADANTYSTRMNNPLQQLSPRLSAEYSFSDRWKMAAFVGRYYQEPTYTVMGYDNELSPYPPQSERLSYGYVNTATLGVEFNPSRLVQWKVEGFYKGYNQMPISLLDSLPVTTSNIDSSVIGNEPIASVGRGRSYGMEFSFRHLDWNNLSLNLSYTLMRAEVAEMNDNLQPTSHYTTSDWDINHILNIVGIYKFGNNWSFGAKWYFSSGFPYTPYDVSATSYIPYWSSNPGYPILDYDLYNALRTTSFHQLDIRLDKMWFFDSWRLNLYLDIQNLYDFNGVGQANLTPNSTRMATPSSTQPTPTTTS